VYVWVRLWIKYLYSMRTCSHVRTYSYVRTRSAGVCSWQWIKVCLTVDRISLFYAYLLVHENLLICENTFCRCCSWQWIGVCVILYRMSLFYACLPTCANTFCRCCSWRWIGVCLIRRSSSNIFILCTLTHENLLIRENTFCKSCTWLWIGVCLIRRSLSNIFILF